MPRTTNFTTLAIAAAVAALTSASPASAVGWPAAVPTSISVDNHSGNIHLYIAAGGATFHAFAAGTCANASADTIKGWLSLSQAAMLAGKKVRIDYSTTTPTCGDRLVIMLAIDGQI